MIYRTLTQDELLARVRVPVGPAASAIEEIVRRYQDGEPEGAPDPLADANTQIADLEADIDRLRRLHALAAEECREVRARALADRNLLAKLRELLT